MMATRHTAPNPTTWLTQAVRRRAAVRALGMRLVALARQGAMPVLQAPDAQLVGRGVLRAFLSVGGGLIGRWQSEGLERPCHDSGPVGRHPRAVGLERAGPELGPVGDADVLHAGPGRHAGATGTPAHAALEDRVHPERPTDLDEGPALPGHP